MARISFATGTAFAVLCFARASKDGLGPASVFAFMAFGGGIAGSVLAGQFGRRARDRGVTEREAWKRVQRTAARELSTGPTPEEP
jgi:hypothetical protein